MHRRKEFLIGTLIGLCIMLLALLAAVVAPRPRAALAQDSPRVAVSVGDTSLNQGDRTYVHVSFYNLPQDSSDDTESPISPSGTIWSETLKACGPMQTAAERIWSAVTNISPHGTEVP